MRRLRITLLVVSAAFLCVWTTDRTPTFAQSWTQAQKEQVKILEKQQEKISRRLLDVQKIGKQLKRLQKWREGGKIGSKPTYDKDFLRNVMNTEKASKSLQKWRKKWRGKQPTTNEEKLARLQELVNALRFRHRFLEKTWEDLDDKIRNPPNIVGVTPDKNEPKTPVLDKDGKILGEKRDAVESSTGR